MSKSTRPSDRERIPIWIWIDPTRRCNLACSLCYTKVSHRAQDLEVDSLREILHRIASSPLIEPQELTLNWRGEPLMNRRLHLLLEAVAESELTCPVQFHTNAMLLTPARAAELVTAAGRVTIYLSIDGGTEASHDRNRGEGSYRRAMTGADNLLRARGSHRWPRIVLYQLDLKEAPAGYDPAFVALGQRVDDWIVATPVLPDGDGRPFTEARPRRGGSEIVDQWHELPRDYPVPEGPCFFAGNSLVVAPDGQASICILSNDERGVIGNVLTEPVETIVLRAQSWRRMLGTSGRRAVPHCAGCRKCEGAGRPAAGATTTRGRPPR